VDLTPRTVEPADAPKRRNNRKWVSIGVLVFVLAAGGVVLTKFLTSSLDYYCNVDEVGHKSGCEANRRLRIQGTVDEGTLVASKGITTFDISFNNVTMHVVYDGDPGGLFQECIPVVVHGELKGETFEGDEVEVKHSNDYEAKNKDRLDEANKESAACLQQQ
jgi:cytochrome c-type biogenesis protein CcmE